MREPDAVASYVVRCRRQITIPACAAMMIEADREQLGQENQTEPLTNQVWKECSSDVGFEEAILAPSRDASHARQIPRGGPFRTAAWLSLLAAIRAGSFQDG